MTPGRRITSTSLRPIGLPRGVVVLEDSHAMPLAVARIDARGHRGPESPVKRIEEQWRLAEAWWRESPERRTYYRVILSDGRPLTLYRDDVTGAWYEQPYSDPAQGGDGQRSGDGNQRSRG